MFKLLLAVCTLQVLLGLTAGRSLARRETILDKGTYLLFCTQSPLELGIVLDSSRSISVKDFTKGIAFLQEFLSHFDIGTGAEGVRVAIITYGQGIYPQIGFNLTTYSIKSDVLEAVGRITHQMGGATDTGKAIQYMNEVQLAPEVVRPEAQKIVIVITDGESTNKVLTSRMAAEAREDGVTMFAVGVGKGINDQELTLIGGNSSMYAKVESYDELPSIRNLLATRTCIQREKPTTTPPPRIQTCGELNPTDVNFVFSPSSLGLDATSQTINLISFMMTNDQLDVGYQYGVISGSCPDDEGFDLGTYSTVDEYRARLESYDVNRLSQLVERLIEGGFNETRGGRPEVNKVAVIVVSRQDLKDNQLLSYQVSQLTAQGVSVFISDPFETGIKLEGAVTLNGGSPRLESETLVSLLCQGHSQDWLSTDYQD